MITIVITALLLFSFWHWRNHRPFVTILGARKYCSWVLWRPQPSKLHGSKEIPPVSNRWTAKHSGGLQYSHANPPSTGRGSYLNDMGPQFVLGFGYKAPIFSSGMSSSNPLALSADYPTVGLLASLYSAHGQRVHLCVRPLASQTWPIGCWCCCQKYRP